MRLHSIWTVRDLLAEFKSDRHLSGFNEDKLKKAVLFNAFSNNAYVGRNPSITNPHLTEIPSMAPMVVEKITLDIHGQPELLVNVLGLEVYAIIDSDWSVIA